MGGVRRGGSLLFQIFRLKAPGRETDSDDDGPCADDDGTGSCSIFNKTSLGLEDQCEA